MSPERALYRRALGDKACAARCIAALVRAETGMHADAGAWLVADALQTVRAFGSAHLKWGGRGD